jgi:lipid-binding SYLF domain-containing protein
MASKTTHLGIRLSACFVLMLALSAAPLFSAPRTNAKDEADRAMEAAEVLTDIMNIPEKGIPDDLMNRAQGIAVIPHVVKGAFGIGGRWGKGLVSERLPDGRWSPPSYIDITGGSFGFQIGYEATDLVLVFTNRQGIDPLIKGKLQLGADAGVTAGPVGRHAAVATDVLLRSSIFSYSRSKGLFAGAALQGSAVTIDDDANRDVYGKTVSAQEILRGRVRSNRIVQPFMDALKRYTPARPIS